MTRRTWLALDIGGANLKAAHTSGAIQSAPFALWKEPDRLPEALSRLVEQLSPTDGVAVTMTGELCDCFATKAEGVSAILSSVLSVFDERKIRVWGADGVFRSVRDAEDRPDLTAASNWMALAKVSARQVPDGLLIDVGSTTTDLIPLRENRPDPRGRTDSGRLRSGELVYVGVKRTPVCALATALPHRGESTGLMAELFATTWDVYLTLGDLADEPEDRSTADGRPATSGFARDRLARMVGEDRDTFSDEDAISLAREADAALVDRLVASARRASGNPPSSVIVSGSGEFLARRIAERVVAPGGSIGSLSDIWGKEASEAACAYALMMLAQDSNGGEGP